MTSPKILTLVIVVVIFQVSLQQHDSTLEEVRFMHQVFDVLKYLDIFASRCL